MEPNRIDQYFLKRGIKVTYNALGATELLWRSYIQASRQLMPDSYETSNHIKQVIYSQSWAVHDREKLTGFERLSNFDQKIRTKLDQLWMGTKDETFEQWVVDSDHDYGSYRSNLEQWVRGLGSRVRFYFSGGMDSEVVLRTMISQGLRPRVVIYRFIHSGQTRFEYSNIEDVAWAQAFCAKHDIDAEFFDIDCHAVWTSDKFLEVSQEVGIVSPQILTHMFMVMEQELLYPGSHHIFGGEVRYLRSPFKDDGKHDFLVKTNLTKALGFNNVIYQAMSRYYEQVNVPFIGLTTVGTRAVVTFTVTGRTWNISRWSKTESAPPNPDYTNSSDLSPNAGNLGGYSGSPLTGEWALDFVNNKYEYGYTSAVINQASLFNGVRAPSVPTGYTSWKNMLVEPAKEGVVYTLANTNRTLVVGSFAAPSGLDTDKWKPFKAGFNHTVFFRIKAKTSVVSANTYRADTYWRCCNVEITGFTVNAAVDTASWTITRHGASSDYQPVLVVITCVLGTSNAVRHTNNFSATDTGTIIAYKWFDVAGAGENLGNTGRYAASDNSGTLLFTVPWGTNTWASLQLSVMWDGNNWTSTGMPSMAANIIVGKPVLNTANLSIARTVFSRARGSGQDYIYYSWNASGIAGASSVQMVVPPPPTGVNNPAQAAQSASGLGLVVTRRRVGVYALNPSTGGFNPTTAYNFDIIVRNAAGSAIVQARAYSDQTAGNGTEITVSGVDGSYGY